MPRRTPHPDAAAEAVSERLLDAAAQVLVEHGLAELTVRRVAERAGTSTMGVYSRYGGRVGILEALYRRLFGELTTALSAVPATADPVADVLALAAAYRNFALAAPQRYAFLFADPLPEFTPEPQLRADTVQDAFAPLMDAVRRASGADTDEAAATDAPGLAVTRASYCLWCVMHGLIGLEFTDVLRAPLTAWGVTGEDEAAAERMYFAGVTSMIAGLELRSVAHP
ncbi:MAG TPA: TetR/AcrR family transcriptional regulator [Actinospica sp.]|nr:TetR/AcrR family transcriptional regulator [Actinospica sp.]